MIRTLITRTAIVTVVFAALLLLHMAARVHS